jgi:hypothetical protein
VIIIAFLLHKTTTTRRKKLNDRIDQTGRARSGKAHTQTQATAAAAKKWLTYKQLLSLLWNYTSSTMWIYFKEGKFWLCFAHLSKQKKKFFFDIFTEKLFLLDLRVFFRLFLLLCVLYIWLPSAKVLQ